VQVHEPSAWLHLPCTHWQYRSHLWPHSLSRHWQRPVNWSHGELLQLHCMAQLRPVQPGLQMQRPAASHTDVRLQ
jgi:hypothetical protein